MTRTTGLALGVICAALLATDARVADLAPALAAVLALGAALLSLLDRRPAARAAAAAAIGIAFVLVRVAVGGPALSPTGPDPLPAGDGPWTVRVETIAAPRDGSQRFVGALDDGAGLRVDVTAPRYPPVRAGDRVEVRGVLRAPPEGPYGAYLARTGVAATLVTRSTRSLDAPADASRVVQGIRAGAGDALARALPEPAAGLAAGILIGLRERVDRELAADFTTTGLSHVVAISGWNIALVAGLVAAFLGTWPRRRRAVATVGAIALYTILAGASASVLRAAVMAGVALLARETGRPGTAARALAWAVVILLGVSPGTVTDAGFQLSAAATAGLLAWGTPLAARLRARVPWLPGFVVEGLAVSLAAQAATLPIVLLSFGRLAPLSPLLNLVVVPLVPLAMATGTLAMVGGVAAGAGAPAVVATLLGLPGAMLIGLLVMIVQTAADLPFAGVTLEPGAGAALGGLAAASLVVVAARRRIARALGPRRRTPRLERVGRPATAGHPAGPGPRGPSSLRSDRGVRLLATLLAVVVALATVAAASRPDGRLHVVALDVGQGDAILIETPAGGRLLVDGGPDPDRLLVALDERIPPWDRRVDLVVVDPPARRPRGRSRASRRAIPGRAGARTGDGGPRSRVRRARGGARQPKPAKRAPGGGRSVRPRRRQLPGALAGSDRGAPRAARHRQRGQQRLDRAARLVRRAAVPPHRRRRGGSRSGPRGPRASAGRPAEGGPPREPNRDLGCAPRRDPARSGARLGRGEEHLRAPRAGHARPARSARSHDLPHGPRGKPGRSPRRARAHRQNRPGAGAGAHADRHRRPGPIPGRRAAAGDSRDRSRRPV